MNGINGLMNTLTFVSIIVTSVCVIGMLLALLILVIINDK